MHGRFLIVWEIAANRPRVQKIEFLTNVGGSESRLRPLFKTPSIYIARIG